MNASLTQHIPDPLPTLRRSLLALLVAGLCSHDLLAESIEEVIVTAQKREEPLQETPIAITAFTETALAKIGVNDIADLNGQVPNVTMRRQGSNSDNVKFGIRGVQTGETTLLADPTVGMYIDGVYVARQTGAVFDVVDLQRIEVLRGPQGALYGRNTIGGAINLITAPPTGQFGVKQKLTVGNRGYWMSRTTVNTPTLETGAGGFAFTLSYLRSDYDGNLKNNADGKTNLNSREAEAYRFATHWDMTDQLALDYAYDYSDRDSRPDSGQLAYVRPNFTAVGGAIYQQAALEASQHRRGNVTKYFTAAADGNTSKIEAHSLTLAWEGDNVAFKSVTGYRTWDATADTIDYGSFLSDGATVLNGAGGLVPAGTPVSLFSASSRSEQEQWSQEFQLVGSLFDDRLDYVAGLYYFEEDVDENNPQSFLLPALFAYGQLAPATQAFLCQGSCLGKDTILGSPLFIYGGAAKSYAAFGQLDYHVTDELDIVLGMRFTRDEKDVFLRKGGLNGNQPIAADDNWSRFNPSLTVTYQWYEALNTYAKVASGYRSGGFNARASTITSFQTPFDEEQVISYELGFKSDWLDRRLRLNGALFYLDYDDRQVTQFIASSSGGAASVVVNAGQSTAQGLELELSALITDGLSMQASYGYTDIEFKDFVTSLPNAQTGFTIEENVDLSSDPRAGNFKPVNAPKNTGSLAFDYEFPAMSWGTVSARLAATYSDGFVNSPILNLYDSTDSHTLLDARLSLSEIPLFGDSSLQVSLWGKNITNEKVRMIGVDFGPLGFASNSYLELASYGFDFVFEL